MKRLLGFLISIIVCIIIVAAIFLYLFIDNVDAMDVDKIDTSCTASSILSKQLGNSVSTMKDTYSIDLNFNEEDLNNLLYSYVKKGINENYDPKNGQSDSEKYVKTIDIPSDIPLLGGKKAIIKHIYGIIDGENVTINLTMNCISLNIRIYFTFNVTETEDDYILNITELKLSKISLKSGIFKKVIANYESQLNQSFENTGLPFTFSANDMQLVSDKTDFSNWVKSLIEDDSGDSTMVKILMDVLLASENKLFNLGMFDNRFGVKIDLQKLKVDNSKITLNSEIAKGFNQELFIKDKSQNLLINSLTGNTEISFTEIELSQLLYDKTNGYADFSLSYEILDGVVFNFSIDGITIDIDDTGKIVTFDLILNINGLKTIATFKGIATQESDSKIIIKIEDEITLGQDIKISSDFLKPILKDSLSESTVLTYDTNNNSFVINSNVFEGFLGSTSLSSKLSVSKIKLEKDNLVVYVESNDVIINSLIASAKNELSDCLSKEFMDSTKFDVSDESQKEAVENLSSSLETVKEKLTNDNLSQDDVDTLIASIDNLSDENKTELYSQLQDASLTDDFTDLYNQLFNK